jgi:hypothetical protein
LLSSSVHLPPTRHTRLDGMSPSWMLLARTAKRGRRPALEVGLGVDEEAAAATLRPRLEVDEEAAVVAPGYLVAPLSQASTSTPSCTAATRNPSRSTGGAGMEAAGWRTLMVLDIAQELPEQILHRSRPPAQQAPPRTPASPCLLAGRRQLHEGKGRRGTREDRFCRMRDERRL